MADLQIRGLTKRYGATVALEEFDLSVEDREFVTLLGPSGSGKTTVLRLIAGYQEPTAGSIALGGRDVAHLPPERRDIGMVFQSYALFPHMTVHNNVGFGLDRRRVPRAERDRRVDEVLTLVGLAGLGGRYPRQLSGGQQQRVALARALVIRPSLLLLDEPLSNLDAQLRANVRLEIRRLQREFGITTVMVTHDQEEALAVSDRVAVMRAGRLEQIDAPRAIYRRPGNRYVADFVGRTNFLSAELARAPGPDTVTLADGRLARLIAAETAPLTLMIRAEALRVGAAPTDASLNRLTGSLVQAQFLGEVTEVVVSLRHGGRVTVRGPDDSLVGVAPGARVDLWCRAADIGALPEERP